jgi:hypothetical protein
MEMVRVLKKNLKNKICSQMYEVFDLYETYVVWKITIDLNKSYEIEDKNEEQEDSSKSIW